MINTGSQRAIEKQSSGQLNKETRPAASSDHDAASPGPGLARKEGTTSRVCLAQKTVQLCVPVVRNIRANILEVCQNL